MPEPLGTFLVPVRVANPETKVSKVLWCIFDSGFTGHLSLDASTIRDLNLKPAGKGKAHTVTGSVDYETFFGSAEIVDENQKSIAHLTATHSTGTTNPDVSIIPIQQFRHPLLGLQSIQQLSWLIVAEKKMLCLVEV